DMQDASQERRRQKIAPGSAQHRAATTQPPRRPIGAGGGEELSRSGSVPVITTHALFALKVQRKLSNGVAGLATAGSSLDRAENRGQFLPSQRLTNARASIPAEILALGPSCVSPSPQLKRDSLCGRNSAGFP